MRQPITAPRRRRRASTPLPAAAAAAVLLAVAASLQCCAGLSTKGLPEHVWRHVLDIEPNRHLQQLGEISETEGVLTRTYFSDAHKRAAQKILRWMEQAGMTAHVDAIGNVHGVIEGSDPDLGELVVGSHYDTVVDGGKYDGALGLILGVSAVKAVLLEALHRAGKLQALQWAVENVAPDDDIDLPARAVKGLLPGSVRVVGFCDEEGIRFKSTFLGSRALAGTLIKHNQLAARGADGESLAEALRRAGVADPPAAVAAIALEPRRVRHYVEFHIEQGPQLEAAGLALGAVSGIAGQTWLSVSVEGVQNHGGTVPMPLRRDPMAAAAEAIGAIEATCLGRELPGGGGGDDGDDGDDGGALDVDGEALMCTVGRAAVYPNQVNIIPRWVNFTVDVRCRRQEFRQRAIDLVTRRVAALCARRGANCTVARTHDAAPVHSDARLVAKLQAAVLRAQPLIAQLVPEKEGGSCGSGGGSSTKPGAGAGAGAGAGGGTCSSSAAAAAAAGGAPPPFRATQAEVPVLLSGAGHDAMAVADITKIAMVFVRCRGGVSHNPAEHVDPRDVAAAAAAFGTFMEMDLLDWEANADESFEPAAATAAAAATAKATAAAA